MICGIQNYNMDNNRDIPLVDEDEDLEELPHNNAVIFKNLNTMLHNTQSFGNSNEDQDEKAKLISRILELQNTLEDISLRVDAVKEENLRLKSENQVLGQYIENLMAASSVFQSTFQNDKKAIIHN
ncbi:unnamed protein product [Gordionus sp. m RMFG-2023]|uniref:short coiled-coil protein B-like n=1 Tax=Gordionus sp. m RMFG-2023 TaxID=3053472 RepID=UPI0030E4E287